MKRFYFPLITALLLASCAPTSIVNTGAGLAQNTAATYRLDADALTFYNDAVPASGVVLVLDGVASTDTRCKTTADKILACRLGDVPANGRTTALAFIGKMAGGSVTWRTPDGKPRGLFILPQK